MRAEFRDQPYLLGSEVYLPLPLHLCLLSICREKHSWSGTIQAQLAGWPRNGRNSLPYSRIAQNPRAIYLIERLFIVPHLRDGYALAWRISERRTQIH